VATRGIAAFRLGKALGQSVYVDHKPGGAGNVAMHEVVRAIGGTPAEFAKFIAVEQQRWKAVITRAKIKPD
jgi:tripartite-type tricarboxylate transporter receptor subunit TctC